MNLCCCFTYVRTFERDLIASGLVCYCTRNLYRVRHSRLELENLGALLAFVSLEFIAHTKNSWLT